MKRYFVILAVLAVFLPVSCSTKENQTPAQKQESGKESEEKKEEPVDNSTKVTIQSPTLSDGTALTWADGEEIAIIDSGNKIYTMTATEAGSKVVFKGDVPGTLTSFKAFYPKDKLIAGSSDTNVNMKAPQNQTGIAGAIAPGQIPMVFKSTSSLKDGITFAPIAAAVRFTLESADIKSVSISVEAKDDNYLGGDIIGVNTTTLNTTIKSAKEKYFSLTLAPKSGSAFAKGDYFFGILTKSTPRSISGYRMTYTKSDGSTIVREITGVLSLSSGSVAVVPGSELSSSAEGSSRVHGTVRNASTGAPIAGVPVSDGMQIVQTGADGAYAFTSNLKISQNVFVIMPSEYEFSANQYGGWNDHKLLDITKNDQQIDFALTPRKDSGDNYRILLLGDPQQMSSRPHSGISWTYVCNAINAYRSSVSVPLYQISLGDMVTNEIEVPGMAEAYLSTQKTSGVLTFSVPGNHDHVQKADNYYYSVSEFSHWFGPYNYAFNLGKQHFVFLDSVAWKDDGSHSYDETLNEQAITFLEKDLALVPTDTPVHIFTHCPLTKKQNAGFPSPSSNARMVKALAGREVNMWYGHIHYNSNYQYTDAELSSRASGVKSLGSHLVSRCGGCWSCSGEICKDGTPRGFVELDIKGKDIHWQFHSIDMNYPHTMNSLVPGRFAGESLSGVDNNALYCNVYLWDNKWGVPEVWAGGSKVATMTRVVKSTDATYDPLYQHFYNIWKAQGLMEVRDEPPGSSENNHLFKYIPSSTVKDVQIRVTDRWGDVHTLDVKW